MKVLLLQPFVTKEKLWGKFAVEGGYVPPIGLLSIAGYLEKIGHNIQIIDPLVNKLTKKDLQQLLRKEKFDLIGIPAFTNTVTDTYNTVKFSKKTVPGSKIIVGGVHATILPKQTMEECKEIDYLAIGEGEFIVKELLDYLENKKISLKNIKGLAYRTKSGKIIINPHRELIQNLDDLPLPAYHLLDMSKYTPHPTQYRALPNFPVIAQRGCPFNCSFCGAHSIHGRKLRSKSVKNLIAEIELLINKYHTKGIYFQDSTFTANRQYVKSLCQEIIKKKLKFQWEINTRVDCIDSELLDIMKKAGLWMIAYGLESGNQKSLDLLNKGTTLKEIEEITELTRNKGIYILSSWILALPGENQEMVENTIKFAKKIGTELTLFFLPIPYPGTDLIALCQKFGGLRNNVKWSDYHGLDFKRPVYINPLIGKTRMQDYIKKAYFQYYFSFKIFYRNLISIRGIDDIKRYWRGIRVLHYGLALK